MRLQPRSSAAPLPRGPIKLAALLPVVEPEETRPGLVIPDDAAAAAFVGIRNPDAAPHPVSSMTGAVSGKVAAAGQQPTAPAPAPAVVSGLRITPRKNPPAPAVVEVQPPDPSDMPSPPAYSLPSGPTVADDGAPAPYESADSVDEIELGMRQGMKPRNRNRGILSNIGGALKSAAIIAGAQARAHPATTWQELMPTVGAAATGLAGGVARPQLDEELDNQARIGLLEGRVERGLRIKERGARVRQINAAADYTAARPGLEQDKLRARASTEAVKREQQNVLSSLRLYRGARLDPNNPTDARLLARAEAAGIVVDPEAWNNARGNLKTFDLIDPEHPEQKRKVLYNVVTGETEDLGQSAYVPPVGEDGLTEAQRRGDADRDRAFSAMERQREVSNDLRRQGLAVAQGHLTLAGQRFDLSKAQFDDKLSERTRSEMAAADKLRAQAEEAQREVEEFRDAGMYKGDDGQMHQAKWAAQRAKTAEAKAEALRAQFFSTYGYLYSPDGGEMKMSGEQFKQLFPSLSGDSSAAQRYGVTLSDESGVMSLPCRGAPAAPGTSAAGSPRAGRFAGRRMPRSNLAAAAKALGFGEGPEAEKKAEATIKAEGGVIY